VIEPSSGGVDQVNREELDDENIRIGFTVILDDVIGSSKSLREARVAHVALKCLGP
jgi:hypothetical protein